MTKLTRISVLLIGIILIFFVISGPKFRLWVEEVDYRYLDGVIFKILGKDQGSAESDNELFTNLDIKADYLWLENFREKEHWVAHGLGGIGLNANKKSSYEAARSAGFNYFEVDIIYSAGKLLCERYEGEISTLDSCTFEWLIEKAKEDNVWFILDVKSEFDQAYLEINKLLKGTLVGKQFIPQIFIFNQLKNIDLDVMSGPLFTGYRRNLRLKYMAALAESLGLSAITLPPNLTKDDIESTKLFVFTHGINNLKILKDLQDRGVSAFYIKTETLQQINKSSQLFE